MDPSLIANILSVSAVTTSLITTIISILNIYRKKRAEQSFKKILLKEKHFIRLNKELKDIRFDKISTLGSDEDWDKRIKILSLLINDLAELSEKDKKILLESVNQPSEAGRSAYSAKILTEICGSE